MPLQHLEHFLIQTEDLESTKDWFVDVLGMKVGPAPDFKFPVYWLYLRDADVLHLTHDGGAKRPRRTGSNISARNPPPPAGPASSTTSRSAPPGCST